MGNVIVVRCARRSALLHTARFKWTVNFDVIAPIGRNSHGSFVAI